jgi:phosphate transport system substrate-binding protein
MRLFERLLTRHPHTMLLAAVCTAAFGLAVSTAEEAKEVKIVADGSTTVGPLAKAFAEYYMDKHPNVKISVSESGSGNGAKALVNGTCDVADMSRFMKPEEFKAAVDKGIMPVAHVVAMDGIAVIVHPANPVKALTGAQLADIYMGKIANWKELGGPDAKMVVITRDTNSGTYECFEEKVLHKKKMSSGVETSGSNGAVRQRVQTTEGAIGYIGLGFVDKTVKALEINGIVPSRDTVVSGKYLIARPLFMFTNGYPEMGSDLQAFVTLHLSKKGQEIVEGIGFVPVTDYQK